MDTVNKLYKNKKFGGFLIFFGALILLSVVLKIVLYRFNYDPVHYPVDYGRWNYFSYFTIQSNIFVAIYLVILGFSTFGNKRAECIVEKEYISLYLTTYIIVTGAVYNAGFPLKMTPALIWNEPYQIFISTVQILHHIIVPLFMIILWFMPRKLNKLKYRTSIPSIIYPAVYSVISIARGLIFKPTFFVYPFYDCKGIYSMLFPEKPYNLAVGILIMIPLLCVGMCLFVAITLALTAIRNSKVKKKIG